MAKRNVTKRTAILVLGCHRSGTSAMTRVLSICGAQLPRRLMSPNSGNPTGYWEPLHVVDFNDRVLASLDVQWTDTFGPRRHQGRPLAVEAFHQEAGSILEQEFGDADLIVLKDPRISLLTDLWLPVLRERGYKPHIVIMVRDPVEVAASLKARDGTTRNQSLIMWTSYMLAADQATRGEARMFVNFQELLTGPESVLDRLEVALNLTLPRRSWEAVAELEQFLRGDVGARMSGRRDSLEKPLSPIDDLFKHFEAAARDAPENEDVPAAAAEWLENLSQVVAPVLATNARAERQGKAALEAERNATAEALAQLQRLSSELDARRQAEELATKDWERVVAEQVSRLEVAQGRIADIEAALAETQSQAQVKDTSLVAGAAEIDRLKAELAAARQAAEAVAEAWKQEDALRLGQLEAARTRLSEMEVELAESQARVEERDATLASAQAHVMQLSSDLEARRHAEHMAAKNWEQVIAEQAARLDAAQRRVSDIEAALADSRAQVEAKDASLAAGHTEINRLVMEVAARRQHEELLRREALERELVLDTIRVRLAERETTLADRNAEVGASRARLAAAHVEINQLTDKLASLETHSNEAVRRARTEAAQALAHADLYQSRLTELNQALHSKELEASARDERITQLEEDLQLMRARHSEAAAAVGVALDKVAESSALAAELTGQVAGQKAHIMNLDALVRDSEARFAEATARADRWSFEAAESRKRAELAEAEVSEQRLTHERQLEFAKERSETFRVRAEALEEALRRVERSSPHGVTQGDERGPARSPSVDTGALLSSVPQVSRSIWRYAPWRLRNTLRTREFMRRGDQARDRGQWPQAASAYDQALRLDPELAHIWVQFGHALKESGNIAKAEAAYRRALKLHPDSADTLINLGHLLKMDGKLEEARAAYGRAMELHPGNAETRMELLDINNRIRGDFQSA